VGPLGWWICALCECNRLVSGTVAATPLPQVDENAPHCELSSSDKDCFDVHFEPPQAADLGDGRGWVEQIVELRDDYGNYDLGTCWESLVGGNHLRMWRQDGSNALFLAYVNQVVSLSSFEILTVC